MTSKRKIIPIVIILECRCVYSNPAFRLTNIKKKEKKEKKEKHESQFLEIFLKIT